MTSATYTSEQHRFKLFFSVDEVHSTMSLTAIKLCYISSGKFVPLSVATPYGRDRKCRPRCRLTRRWTVKSDAAIGATTRSEARRQPLPGVGGDDATTCRLTVVDHLNSLWGWSTALGCRCNRIKYVTAADPLLTCLRVYRGTVRALAVARMLPCRVAVLRTALCPEWCGVDFLGIARHGGGDRSVMWRGTERPTYRLWSSRPAWLTAASRSSLGWAAEYQVDRQAIGFDDHDD